MAKPFLIERRPLMLKDYLLRDDLSSCSSNGFKSFPRRKCCTTVRFLVEKDLKAKTTYPSTTPSLLKRSRSTTISALQKASSAVINAVKLLPFPSSSDVKSLSPAQNNKVRKGSLLSRSLSRKLFKRSFCKRADKEEVVEIKRGRLFREFLEEKDTTPSDQMEQQPITAISATENASSSISTGSSRSDSNSNSWMDSESTGESSQHDAAETKSDLPKQVGDRDGVTAGQDSAVTAKVWPNEEKEQFSPVSVLDCPFQDEEDSPFQCSLVRIKGSQQKVMKTIRRFESLAQIEPVDLDRSIALAESSDDESLQCSTQSCSISSTSMSTDIEENGAEKEAQEALKLAKATTPSNALIAKAVENLLLDFFLEKIEEKKINNTSWDQDNWLQVAEEWINGQPQEMFLGWEVKDFRHVYIKDMEKNDQWKILDEEKEEMAVELELQIFTDLLHQVLLDVF